MLTQEMAKEIVEQTMIRLNRNINIMDETGTIIASGNPNRINQIHFGALEVLRSGQPLIINDSNLHEWNGAHPGINLPIQFQNLIIGVIGITGDSNEVREFGELVKMITEMMIHQSFIAAQLEWRQRLKEQVFEDLLKDRDNIDTIKQRLNLLGIDIEAPYQVGLVELGINQLKNTEIIQIFEDTFVEKQALIGFSNANRVFILTSNMPETRFMQKLAAASKQLNSKNISVRIGIGSIASDQTCIRHSYQESLNALLLGSNEQMITTYAEIEMKALLVHLDERAKRQFSSRVLGNLSEKLIETIEHFFAANLNIGECATKMYIHRNSLVYRIKKIKELTGYNPQLVSDAITLQLAVWIDRMSEKQD
ncbi:CdaR family transcriptional regulator [Bacillus sp. V33-4]|uniref:CdaR family transcriptional regulator n=1 Tax=Bacillus sp. V33-4 TaxID=2054169 RepID=UPI000C79264B|nr:sugar diacid recognition domain-containing protein [Bacillus sp. V33-4]PLR80411.1 sugar diacid utilization regulator SdaR [Bacillus sp. V33-4]